MSPSGFPPLAFKSVLASHSLPLQIYPTTLLHCCCCFAFVCLFAFDKPTEHNLLSPKQFLATREKDF